MAGDRWHRSRRIRTRLRLRAGLALVALLVLVVVISGCGSGSSGATGSGPTDATGGGSSTTAEGSTTEASTVSSEGSSEAPETTLTCPSAAQLQEDVPLPVEWNLYEQGKHEAERHYEYDGHVIPAFDRACQYVGDTETYGYKEVSSSLVVIFADYPSRIAKERFAAQQTSERECSPQSICGDDGQVLEEPTSFAALVSYPPYEEGEPFSSHVDAAAVTEGTVCEMLSRYGTSNELFAPDEEALLGSLRGLQRFIRTACGLPEEAEEGEEPEGSSEGVSSLAGTTDDQAGAEQTYLAYNQAIGEDDYETACELTTQRSLGKLPRPCPDVMNSVFHAKTFSPHELKELETKVIEDVPETMREGELLWDGSEWLVEPDASEQALEEE